MAIDLEKIRATAERVAGSYGLEVVDVEFVGGGKHRVLRVSIEKDAAGRQRMAAEARAAAEHGLGEDGTLPAAVVRGELSTEHLSGVTHEDCEQIQPRLRYGNRCRGPGSGDRVHARGFLARTGSQAEPAGGLRAFSRQPGKAADISAGCGQPPLAGPIDFRGRGQDHARPFRHPSQGESKEGSRGRRHACRNRIREYRKGAADTRAVDKSSRSKTNGRVNVCRGARLNGRRTETDGESALSGY